MRTPGNFDLNKCVEDENLKIEAQYAYKYFHKGNDGTIRFFTAINPDSTNDPPRRFSFARANRGDVDIERGQPLKPGVQKVFTVNKTLVPCQELKARNKPMNRFVSELQMNGYVVGFENNNNYSCSARDFYSHKITYIYPPESEQPSTIPSYSQSVSVSPSIQPSAVPSSSSQPSSTTTPSYSPSVSVSPSLQPSAVPSSSSQPSAAPSYFPSVSVSGPLRVKERVRVKAAKVLPFKSGNGRAIELGYDH